MIRTAHGAWRRHVKTILIATAAGHLLSCSDQGPDNGGTFFGPVAALADGSARSYVILDRSGTPTEVGLAITATALTGLPAASTEYVFELPSESSATAYRHAAINWQPTGHPPAMVYTVPHFDAHF